MSRGSHDTCHVLSHVMINARYPYLHSQSVPGSGSGAACMGNVSYLCWSAGTGVTGVLLGWELNFYKHFLLFKLALFKRNEDRNKNNVL